MNPDIELADMLTDVYIMSVIAQNTEDPIRKRNKFTQAMNILDQSHYVFIKWGDYHNIRMSGFVNGGESLAHFTFGAFVQNHLQSTNHGIYMNPVQFKATILHMIRQEVERRYARY